MQLLVNSESVDGRRTLKETAAAVASEHGSPPASSSPSEGGGGSGSGGAMNNNSNSNSSIREKPAKVIPCPRCESMNTKFCYFNNYSVKQPRYFCRQCQRYWTVGGTLRNVPVGGGSRKKSRNQRSEPYLRSSSAAIQGSGSGGISGGIVVSAPGALSGSSPLLQTMGFQQLLMQEHVNMPPYNMVGYQLQEHYPQEQHQQNPAAATATAGGLFYPVMPQSKSMSPHEVSAMHHHHHHQHAMYASSRDGGNANPNLLHVNGSSYHSSTPGHMENNFIHGLESMGGGGRGTQWGNSVPEHFQSTIWHESSSAHHHPSGSPGGVHNASGEDQGNSNMAKQLYVKAEGGYEPSNMLLHFGLNNNKPRLEAAGSVAPPNPNGSSPPHGGSSTIEEEGSTPTNGYSTNGYEDGDAVSSMWPDLEFFH